MNRFVRRHHPDKGPLYDVRSIISYSAFPILFLYGCLHSANGFTPLGLFLLTVGLAFSAFLALLALRNRFWGLRISGDSLVYRTLLQKKFTPGDIAAIRIARSVRHSFDGFQFSVPDITDGEGNPLYSMILLNSYDPEQMGVPDPTDIHFCSVFRKHVLAQTVYDKEVIEYLTARNPHIAVISSVEDCRQPPRWNDVRPRPIPEEGLFLPLDHMPTSQLLLFFSFVLVFFVVFSCAVSGKWIDPLSLFLLAVPSLGFLLAAGFSFYEKRAGLYLSPAGIQYRTLHTKPIDPMEIRAIRISKEVFMHAHPTRYEDLLDKWGNQYYLMFLLSEYDPLSMHHPDGNDGAIGFLTHRKKSILLSCAYDQTAIDCLKYLNPDIIVIPPDGGTPIFPTGGQQRGWIINVTHRDWDN